MQDTYELKITYTYGRELASWDFNREGAQKCCHVDQGDFVNVTFDGPGEIGQCVMLCGQMGTAETQSSPFIQGNSIDLKDEDKRTLEVSDKDGRWGFSIAFTARNADGTSSFYYVPDPEIIVKSRPISGD